MRGPGALNAVRAYTVTYPAEAHSEDYAPRSVWGSIASAKQRRLIQTRKLGNERWGKDGLILHVKKGYIGPPH
jgi:hypothetical protein